MRRLSAVLLCSLFIAACSEEPTAPVPVAVVAAGARAPKESVSPSVAVADAIDRLLPALDAETAASLQGPLNSIAALLKQKGKDRSALKAAIVAAEAVLATPLAANDERAPDLAAIALALAAAAK